MSSGASTSDPVARAISMAKSAFETVRTKLAAMTRPAKVMIVGTAVAAVVLAVWVGYRSSDTTWSVLFSNLDREDASAVVAKLKEMKVPYRLEGDGGTIEVPQASARELRLELAGSGLPRGGGVGFESFDKMRLGATEFEQRVLFRRALEGELARTIDTIASVQSARVHLVLPERSVFVGRNDPASASVVLKLRGGRALGSAEVAGIVHLVSSSVAGLTPERVAVVTTEGAMLHKPRRAGEGGNEASGTPDEEQTSAARSLESTLEERARSMLERVVGSGHVDVRVTAELDRARVERVEDRYDPKQVVVRSEQKTVERTSAEPTAAGVPGAESNLPNGKTTPAGQTDGVTRESSTRNFEVDHVTEKRLVVSGTIRRLTVAVVVDGTMPGGGVRAKEEVERLNALVRSAVGADPARGDMVTVEAVPFLVAEKEPVPPPPPSIVPDRFKKYVPAALGGVLGVALLGTFVVVMRRRKRQKAVAATTSAIVLTPSLDTDPPAELMAPALRPEELRLAAHDRAAEDPATAALVLRFWLGEGDDESNSLSRTLSEGTTVA